MEPTTSVIDFSGASNTLASLSVFSPGTISVFGLPSFPFGVVLEFDALFVLFDFTASLEFEELVSELSVLFAELLADVSLDFEISFPEVLSFSALEALFELEELEFSLAVLFEEETLLSPPSFEFEDSFCSSFSSDEDELELLFSKEELSSPLKFPDEELFSVFSPSTLLFLEFEVEFP